MAYSQPTLTITATQSATYTCMAENNHVNGYTNVNSTAHILVIGEYLLCSVEVLRTGGSGLTPVRDMAPTVPPKVDVHEPALLLSHVLLHCFIACCIFCCRCEEKTPLCYSTCEKCE